MLDPFTRPAVKRFLECRTTHRDRSPACFQIANGFNIFLELSCGERAEFKSASGDTKLVKVDLRIRRIVGFDLSSVHELKLTLDARRFFLRISLEGEDAADLLRVPLLRTYSINNGSYHWERYFETVDDELVDGVFAHLSVLQNLRRCTLGRSMCMNVFAAVPPESVCPNCALTLSEAELKEEECCICMEGEYIVGMTRCSTCTACVCQSCDDLARVSRCPVCRRGLKRPSGYSP